MILPLMLTDEQMQRVQNARASGIDVNALLLEVVDGLPHLTAADLRSQFGYSVNGSDGNGAHSVSNATPIGTPVESITLPTPKSLIEQWLEEDATDDPRLISQAEEELEQFKTNMNRWRAENGERLLFV